MRYDIKSALLVCTFGLQVASFAQTPPPPTTNQPVASLPAAAAPATEILRLLAIDKDGRPITDLKAEDLRLRVNKEELKILSVSPSTDEPKTIGLFFDISGSRRSDKSIGEETRLMNEFLRSIWHPDDTAFVVGFNDQLHIAAQPSHKLEDIDEGLAKTRRATDVGSTALYDALCQVLKPEKLAGIPGRKIYVVFSDFEDNASKNRADDVLEVALKGGVSIFPIILSEGFNGGGYSKRSEHRVRELARTIADQTGGEVLIPESPKQLAATFERLTSEIQTAYRITYIPSPLLLEGQKKNKKIQLETARPHVRLIYPKA